jgi:hypothetical protein
MELAAVKVKGDSMEPRIMEATSSSSAYKIRQQW